MASERLKILNALTLGYFHDLYTTTESIDNYQDAIENLKAVVRNAKDAIKDIEAIWGLYTLRNQLLIEQNGHL
jgi:hypothetical protein